MLATNLKRYFPNDVLCTAYDIIPFWVNRMTFQGLHFTGKRPELTNTPGVFPEQLHCLQQRRLKPAALPSTLPVIHVHMDPAGLERRVQVLSERFCGQDVSTFFLGGLNHELRIKHSLFSNLLASII